MNYDEKAKELVTRAFNLIFSRDSIEPDEYLRMCRQTYKLAKAFVCCANEYDEKMVEQAIENLQERCALDCLVKIREVE
jgi:hypothetical protein